MLAISHFILFLAWLLNLWFAVTETGIFTIAAFCISTGYIAYYLVNGRKPTPRYFYLQFLMLKDGEFNQTSCCLELSEGKFVPMEIIKFLGDKNGTDQIIINFVLEITKEEYDLNNVLYEGKK